MKLSLYEEVKGWKIPLHKTKTAIAKSYLKLIPKVEIVGIAGSVGKTLTQNSIYSVLTQKYPTVAGEENLDPTFRIPKTILKTKPWHRYMILEYGIEHPGEMDYYTSIAQPKYAVLTTLSEEHLKYFKSLEGAIEEESKFVKNLPKNSYAILNTDDPRSQTIAKSTNATVVWYGSHAKRGVKISHYTQNLHGSKYRLHYGGDIAIVHTKIIGKHQLSSAYAAATVGILTGLTIKQIAKGLSNTIPPVHRLNVKTTEHANIIDDTYNSSPQAVTGAVKTLQDLGKGKKKIIILGEMRDLGDYSLTAHERLGQIIAKTRINYLITVGKTATIISRAAKKGRFRGKIINVRNTKEASTVLKPLISKKTVVLVKGSRHEHLERIVLALLHKSTAIECYQCRKLK